MQTPPFAGFSCVGEGGGLALHVEDKQLTLFKARIFWGLLATYRKSSNLIVAAKLSDSVVLCRSAKNIKDLGCFYGEYCRSPFLSKIRQSLSTIISVSNQPGTGKGKQIKGSGYSC